MSSSLPPTRLVESNRLSVNAGSPAVNNETPLASTKRDP